jgi:hypothetical protein
MYGTTADSTTGFVEFDERGNGRWLPHTPVNSDETLIRLLDTGRLALALELEESVDVHRDGFGQVIRAGR